LIWSWYGEQVDDAAFDFNLKSSVTANSLRRKLSAPFMAAYSIPVADYLKTAARLPRHLQTHFHVYGIP